MKTINKKTVLTQKEVREEQLTLSLESFENWLTLKGVYANYMRLLAASKPIFRYLRMCGNKPESLIISAFSWPSEECLTWRYINDEWQKFVKDSNIVKVDPTITANVTKTIIKKEAVPTIIEEKEITLQEFEQFLRNQHVRPMHIYADLNKTVGEWLDFCVNFPEAMIDTLCIWNEAKNTSTDTYIKLDREWRAFCKENHVVRLAITE